MAAPTWTNGNGTNIWSDGANWSTAVKPQAGDDVTFDNTSVANCTLDENTANLNSLTIAATYTGVFHGNGGTVQVTGGGDVDVSSVTTNFGGGPWNCAGNWKSVNCIEADSLVTLSGTTKTLEAQGDLDVIISGSYSTAGDNTRLGGNILTVNGTLTITAKSVRMRLGTLAGNGTINGTSSYQTYRGGTISFNGTLSVATLYLDANVTISAVGSTIASANVQCQSMDAAAKTLTLNDVTFSGAVTIDRTGVGDYTIANNTNDPDITFQGGVTVQETGGEPGTLNWVKGAGTVSCTGTGNQTLDFDGQAIEDFAINKSAGDVVLAGDLTADSFTGTDTGTGDFDPNGQTITTVGACDWAAAFDFDSAADCMNGCSWVIDGNFTADGQSLKATAGWSLEVAGTAVASGAGDVAHSDANGVHTEIDASAVPWTDNNNNTNWNFGGAPAGFARGKVGASLAGRGGLVGGGLAA